MTITRRTTKPTRPKRTVSHTLAPPPLDKPVFVTKPFFGSSDESPLFDEEGDYYSDDDDFDLQEALEQLEYDSGSDGDYWGHPSIGMSEAWASSVPNRLGKAAEGSSAPSDSDEFRSSCLGLPLSLPYEVETLEEMDDRLDYICCKLAECIKARDWHTGFKNWDSALNLWQSMGYQMKKEMKIKLTFVYWEMIFVPGLPSSFLEDAGNCFISFITDRALSIHDFRIPWRPLLDALYDEIFPNPLKPSRHTTSLAPLYLNIAESAQRYFHPGDVDEMLEVILPRATASMDSIIATQTMLVHFLPISHCQKWLPLVFRLWHGFNSGMWDDQASDLVGQLSIAHLDPARSDPSMIGKIPRGIFNTPEEEAANPAHAKALRAHKSRLLDVAGEIQEDEDGLNYWPKPELLPEPESQADPKWQGIRKDVGIFTDQEFEFIMSKCLRSLNVPVGGAVASSSSMSLTHSDARVSKKIVEAKKPIDRVQSLAEAIVNSMSNDAPPAPTESLAPTPGNMTPKPQAVSRLQNGMKRSDSGDSLAAAGNKGDTDKKYLGGSKALDHLSRLLTSCETFFHPSNSGTWSQFLTVFLAHLTINFVDRWKDEEDPDCKTPKAWRLTPAIKREFVLCIRPLALTAVFIKGMDAMTGAIGALKCLAVLEPDLIMPAALERAIPSLQGLEETARTPAVTYMLATLAEPLSARRIWKYGGIYIPDIFNLLLPGIDLNDPSKTGLSCMAISNMVDLVHLSDISDIDESDTSAPGDRALRKTPRIAVPDDDNEPVQMEEMNPEEVASRIRLATSTFRDWVPEFIGRIILLFANLPEEGGKSGKAGGKTEQLTLMSVLHTSGAVFVALDDKLFDGALEQIYEYVTTTARGNAVDAVGELVRNMSAANSDKVFAKLFPIAKQRILAELKAGASSTRTTTTSIPLASDAALHWWQSILYGMLVPGRLNLSKSEYRDSYIELLQVMVDSTYSERGYVWTGKILEKSMTCLVALYFTEMSMIPPKLRATEDFKNNHTAYWGKLYRAAELKPEWRVPTAEDVNMAFEIISIADKSAIKVGQLIENKAFGDKVWTNEFCRAVHVINQVLKGSYNLILESEASKTGGMAADSYMPDEILELPPPYKSSMLLTDPNDPRHQHIQAFLQRVGETLHQAASATRNVGESDNSVESVKSLVTTIGTYMTSYGLRSKQFGSAQAAYAGMQGTKRMYDGQRKHHRSIFMGAVTIHHQNRLSSMNYYRVRSNLDDRLILNMLEFSLSPFTRIRRSAQAYLETITRTYRGSWVLCFPTLFDALQPGTDPDRMKGALYVLRYNAVGIARIGRTLNWYQGHLVQLVEGLLSAHHETKASIQALVTKAIEELLGAIREPTSAIIEYRVESLDKAVDSMVEVLRYKPDADLIQRFYNNIRKVKVAQDEQWDLLVDRVIAIASQPQLNWRYVLSASRVLLQVQRRDKPTDVRMAKFHSESMLNPHPKLRDYAIATITKMLYTVVMRHLCLTADKPEERLFLQEPFDPFTKTIDLTDTSESFVHSYFQSFKEPPPADGSQAMMQDRSETGWLVWGKTMEVSRMTGPEEDAFCMDESSSEGVAIIEKVMTAPTFWQTVADYWAQEDTRTHPSAGNIDAVIASSQLFGPQIFDLIRPIIDGYLAEMDTSKVYDRHKTRAMWEFICGVVRGAEEWSGNKRQLVWDWLTPKLPELFNNIRHDTVKCWMISIEFLIHDRDPRRYPALFGFLIQTGLDADFANGSSFDLVQRVQVIRSLVARLGWRFTAWADDFTELYFGALSCPYAEVRVLVSSILNSLDQLKFHPSYPSAKALTDDVMNDPTDQKDIMKIRSAPFQPQMQEIMKTLPELKKDRPHGPKAVQSAHDLTANSILTWLITECSDVRAVAAFTYIIPFLPELFELREMNDNQDLQRISGRLLAMITSITPSLELIEPLMDALMSILKNAESWKTKTNCMPVLSLVYYRNLSLLSESCKAKALDVVAHCLRDPNQEVREIASSTLSGFLRCSQRPMVDVLRHRFTNEILSTNLPKRRDAPGQVNPEYQAKVVELHGAILGATALVEAFPYTVPKFLPKLLADVLAPKVSEPAPVSTTIRNTVASFKRTHEKYQDKFTEDELSAMNYAQAGNSYCKSFFMSGMSETDL